MDIIKVLIEFITTFIIVHLFYYIIVIRKCKKNKKMVSAEVNLIVTLNQIDIKNIDLYQMVKVVSIVTTVIISIIITLIWQFFDNTIILLLFGSSLSVIIAFICYGIIGKYYKKKSIKNSKITSKLK